MGYNVKVCEKRVERIQKEILKQKKLIVDLNVKIRKLKKELKPRKLKGGGDSETSFELAKHTIYGLNYDVLSNFSILKGIAINNREDLLTIKIPLILENVKLDIQKTSNIYNTNNFIDIMVFINNSIQKLKNEQKRESSDRIPKLLLRVKDALDLFEYYIQHNMNSRLEMFNDIFIKIKEGRLSMAPFITYIISEQDCYIIEDYQLGNIIIQASTKNGIYGIITEMINHKRYFDITEYMKSIVENDSRIMHTLVEKLSNTLKDPNSSSSLYNKYGSNDTEREIVLANHQEAFNNCIDIFLLDKKLKIKKKRQPIIFFENNKELLIDKLKIAAQEDHERPPIISKKSANSQQDSVFSQIFDRITYIDIDNDNINNLANFAASNGFLNVLKKINNKYNNKNYTKSEDLCRFAAHNGHIDVLKWAHANGFPLNDTCWAAALNGHLEVLQWARASGCPWDESTCSAAAGGGNLEVLQWARASGCPWDESTCEAAARGGHLAVLQWAHKNGCPWNDDTCFAAASGGHLEVLQWARASGCPWIETIICSAAAGAGHLAMLQWARENGCSWNHTTCKSAARGGHLTVLQWAHTNGCPWNEDTCKAAAENGHLNVLQFARSKDCPWDEGTCIIAAAKGHFDILQWARANGCPWNIHNIINEIHLENFIILRWIFEYNDTTGCNFSNMFNGTGRLYPYVVKWYIDNNVIADISEETILKNKTYNIDTQFRIKNLMSKINIRKS